ncbi:hypothetical protein IFM89_009214 [Coptis chinensis]|uniref:Uncharacterized protein n=1 Tax=Coptis chinensis TaxID=261450 RepID=A0A835IVG8_9MAGN|nr:hypothetical protein IFM89_009214 [Coptis chinensis]
MGVGYSFYPTDASLLSMVLKLALCGAKRTYLLFNISKTKLFDPWKEACFENELRFSTVVVEYTQAIISFGVAVQWFIIQFQLVKANLRRVSNFEALLIGHKV